MNLRERIEEYLPLIADLIGENLHLYLITVAYWLTVGAFLGLRYLLRRRGTSDRLRLPIVLLGVVAFIAAAIDILVRGSAGITHVSLVAYLATPIGLGRYFVARWDGRPPRHLAGLGMRLTTYLVAFVAFVALSVLDGNPWFFSAPEIDRSSPEALLENTAWMPFLATVFGLILVLEAVTGLFSSGRSAARSEDAGRSAR